MSSEHKGGVVYDYWVSNPWHGRDSLKLSTANATPEATTPVATATRKEDSHDVSIPGGDDVALDINIQEPLRAAMPGGPDAESPSLSSAPTLTAASAVSLRLGWR